MKVVVASGVGVRDEASPECAKSEIVGGLAAACQRRRDMRNRFDQFGKQIVRAALEARGVVETDADVPAGTRRIDLWFMPSPAVGWEADHLGLLGRLTRGASTLEFFHNTPNGDDLADCMVKHGEFLC